MGDIVHRAVIVTSWDRDALREANARAVVLFGEGLVTKIQPAPCNGYASFAVLPCGSKLGWSEWEDNVAAVTAFREYLQRNPHLSFVDVRWGENAKAQIVGSRA